MKISVFEDLKIFDAGSKSNIEKIINDINIIESNVIIDLSKCIIDYPATSILMDKILLELRKFGENRHLTIQTHLNIFEPLLLHWLFIGSVLFNLDGSKRKLDIDEFKNSLSQELKKNETLITLQIIDKDGKNVNNYVYGN